MTWTWWPICTLRSYSISTNWHLIRCQLLWHQENYTGRDKHWTIGHRWILNLSPHRRRDCLVSSDYRIEICVFQVYSALLLQCHAGKGDGGLFRLLGRGHLDFKRAHKFGMRINGLEYDGIDNIKHCLLWNVGFENEWLCSEAFFLRESGQMNWQVKTEGLHCSASLPIILCTKWVRSQA